MGQGIVTPSGGIYDQDTQVILTATPASGWAFLRWLGDVHALENPVTVTVDATMTVIAEFIPLEHATGLDLVADLGDFLVATGDLVNAGDVLNLEFDRGGGDETTGNGIPDAAEFMLLQAILERPTFNPAVGGTARDIKRFMATGRTTSRRPKRTCRSRIRRFNARSRRT
jgi:CBS domain-containing protein